MKTNPVLILIYLFLNVNFHFEDIDWNIRLKQCVTSLTIDLFFTTNIIKFSSLTSLSMPPPVIQFFMKIKK